MKVAEKGREETRWAIISKTSGHMRFFYATKNEIPDTYKKFKVSRQLYRIAKVRIVEVIKPTKKGEP